MVDAAAALATDGWQFDRLLGRRGDGTGVAVVLFGGIHGNEPAGVLAIQQVFEILEEHEIPLHGRVLGVSGNRQALARGRRYLDHDLNRRWSVETLEALRARLPEECVAEEREQRELVEVLDPFVSGCDGTVVCIDLHTTSGSGPPFAAAAAGPRNRLLGSALPIPLILGVHEMIQGTMLNYMAERSYSGISIEGGQHRDPETVNNHVACVWLLLVSLGMIEEKHVPDLEEHGHQLARTAEGMPHAVAMSHRHVILPGDEFVMEPGFKNFQPVEEGQLIAHNRHGPVLSPQTGRILLPRYQGQGEDGFFVVRDVTSPWT